MTPTIQTDSLPEPREVPAYRILFWDGKRHDACVTVPVINEGPRIQNLLERMRRLRIDEIADILVVDGGSTDGSLEESGLRALGVAGVAVKNGPGHLSAQLRCAYAFLLGLGYERIVTIDGNDKDDPEPIPRFLEALAAGYDFIQASRFIAGGSAENTPLARTIAIRMIHAPALALSSGFAWTDTTQGFRAYRRRLLLDPRLSIFRNVFQEYELLAYLSHKAPRLGFRCLELPSKRSYPSGEVPTKISSVRGNAKLLTTLWKACTGRYDLRIPRSVTAPINPVG